MRFADRADAGRRLGASVEAAGITGDGVVVVGLPRGSVPVADEVARAIGAPLDVVLVRKIRTPGQPELAAGAVGEAGVLVVDERLARLIGPDEVRRGEKRARAELERAAARFRTEHPAAPLEGRTVVIVDDGVATGSTARAACQVVRARGAAEVVVAVPVGPPDVDTVLLPDADRVICPERPTDFVAVGQAYADFSQLDDDEVVAVLRAARLRRTWTP
ncbi:MAG: phosphoribosyltransferase [Jatrophihabitans sp.]|uniref:phosphoribosyltransferase n=1 Tax=Jatrophihabitans sp. TaxID=1932789 RepID=UPI003F811009